MTSTPLDAPRRPATRRRGITARGRVLAAAGVVLATVVAGSLALFTDSGDVRTTLTAGTLDLKFDADEDGTPAYDVAFAGGTDMAPGDSASYDLGVYNSGSVAADLAMAVPQVAGAPVGGPSLADQMTLRVTDLGTSTVLYEDDLVDASVTGGQYFTGLPLGSGGSPSTATRLRFEVALKQGATTDVAGQSITITFPFVASQTP